MTMPLPDGTRRKPGAPRARGAPVTPALRVGLDDDLVRAGERRDVRVGGLVGVRRVEDRAEVCRLPVACGARHDLALAAGGRREWMAVVVMPQDVGHDHLVA